MSNKIRWGILGTGFIAKEFALGLATVPEAEIVAVASRSLKNAQAFAGQFKIPKAYDRYEDLVNDANVDVVYIATPNNRHKDDCILSLNAGKAVLCEKPFSLNAQEARQVIDLARDRKVFCMEAMWMRFMPLIQEVKNQVATGAIGEINLIVADFGYHRPFSPEDRLYSPELGGGALLDRGVYPLSLVFYLLGTPSDVVSKASLAPTGVDQHSGVILSYPQGALAILTASVAAQTSNEALIVGTKGQIRIHEPFYRPEKISLQVFPEAIPGGSSASGGSVTLKDKLKQNALVKGLYRNLSPLLKKEGDSRSQPVEGNGYNYEAAEVIRCLKAGELESKIMPLDQTLAIMETLDRIRDQLGVKYPQE